MSPSVTDADKFFSNIITGLVSPVFQFIIVITFLYFLYGVMMFVLSMKEPEKYKTGKSHLLWGTVGLFIVFSINGIVSLLTNSVGGFF
jgi:hypothetical protein